MNANEERISLTGKERRQHFIYLLLMFLVVAPLLIWVTMRNTNAFAGNAAGTEKNYIRQEAEFEARQRDALPLYDTIFSQITALRNTPVSSTAVEESDIKNRINTLNGFNEDAALKDLRFMAFSQMARFLQLYFNDMQVIKKKMENIRQFNDQLSQCEIGLKDQQALMNGIKTAQSASTK